MPEIVREETETVIRIYRLFISGKSISFIARTLTEEDIPIPGGKVVWQPHTETSILTNEKYKVSALLQKRHTVDFLTKTTKVN